MDAKEEVLKRLEAVDLGHSHKFSIGYQSWDFPFTAHLKFLPEDTPAKKRELILSTIEVVHSVINMSIRQELPRMQQELGEGFSLAPLFEIYGVKK